jgi:hypothetical protein
MPQTETPVTVAENRRHKDLQLIRKKSVAFVLSAKAVAQDLAKEIPVICWSLRTVRLETRAGLAMALKKVALIAAKETVCLDSNEPGYISTPTRKDRPRLHENRSAVEPTAWLRMKLESAAVQRTAGLTSTQISLAQDIAFAIVGNLLPDDCVALIDGQDLIDAYDKGVGYTSCMCGKGRDPTKTPVAIYAENPDTVKMAIYSRIGYPLTKNRGLVWIATDGTKYLDRIYPTTGSPDNQALAMWCYAHGIAPKGYCSRQSGSQFPCVFPPKYPMFKLVHKIAPRIPYMDTILYQWMLEDGTYLAMENLTALNSIIKERKIASLPFVQGAMGAPPTLYSFCSQCTRTGQWSSLTPASDLPRYEYKYVEGIGTMCPACLANRFITCGKCKKSFDKNKVTMVQSHAGVTICKDCADSCAKCADCARPLFHTGQDSYQVAAIVKSEKTVVCSHCVSYNGYCRCQDCGVYYKYGKVKPEFPCCSECLAVRTARYEKAHAEALKQMAKEAAEATDLVSPTAAPADAEPTPEPAQAVRKRRVTSKAGTEPAPAKKRKAKPVEATEPAPDKPKRRVAKKVVEDHEPEL